VAVLANLRQHIEAQNAARARQGAPPVASVDWALAPVFDADRYMLEWAIRAKSVSGTVINHTIRLLGRHGVLDATSVQADQASSDAVPLKELVSRISFKPGERYADHQPGDKVTELALADLIVGQESQGDSSYMVRAAIWAGVIFLATAVTGLVVVLRRNRRNQKKSSLLPGRRDNPLAPLFRNGAGSRRRRVFNYHKFYSDMMLQVSSGPTTLEPAAINGKHASRETNGRASRPEAGADQVIVRANLELIANQTNLIEEQKQLMQEQSKLIEEKSRLIREKNHLLEKQAELFERDLL
jgi:hypothetical protein